jgi:dTDP-4-amino-4,6-dideoxygalactose transaminase
VVGPAPGLGEFDQQQSSSGNGGPVIGPKEIASVAAVVRSGRLGRYSGEGDSRATRFERSLAGLLGTRHALGVNSGTSALMSALVGVGVGPGDEVLVPAYTWVSSAAAALAIGAVPVLVEVDESLTMDPVDLKGKITERSKAVVPVHMLNLVCDMDALLPAAREAGLAVVEDACQALGVRYGDRRAGTLGDAGAFSFSQTKNITSGEGGAVVTADDRVAARATMFHDVGSYIRAGWQPSDEPLFVGLNLKMSELTAAVLRPQLARLDRQLARREARRRVVVEELAGVEGLRIAPHHSPGNAVGLVVTFDDVDDAVRFGSMRGAHRLLDSSRHVYTNWHSLLGGRTYSDRFTPYAWAGREGTLDPESCPVTLDVLARSCVVSLRPDRPLLAHRAVGRRLAAFRR